MIFSDRVQKLPGFGLVQEVLEFGVREYGMRTADSLRVDVLDSDREELLGRYDAKRHLLKFKAALKFTGEEADAAFVLLHELRHAFQHECGMQQVADREMLPEYGVVLTHLQWRSGEDRRDILNIFAIDIAGGRNGMSAYYELTAGDDMRRDWRAIVRERRRPLHIAGVGHAWRLPEEQDADWHALAARERFYGFA